MKPRKTRALISVILAAVLAATLGISACAGGSPSQSATPQSATSQSGGGSSEPSTVTLKFQGLGGSPNTTDAPTIGVAQGYFAEEGIEVQNVGNIQVPQWVPSLENGDIDACLIMTSEGLAAIDNGSNIIAVAGGSDTYGAENTHMTFLVKKDSPIRTFKEAGIEAA
ncbi:MAG: hypothetical protein LBP28_02445 [Coriobacteriales bacterium]|jgi:ABC-type phosphate/phosphonate transport system substrate-binding protein|nr:hypothetical protein [Coriobacteriales bacterium]